jgi:hypothetical protein
MLATRDDLTRFSPSTIEGPMPIDIDDARDGFCP